MPPVAHHALLGLAVAALGAAGLRVAGSLGARGLSRGVAAAPIAVTAAVVETLALGLLGLGASTPLLVIAACATWLAASSLARPARAYERFAGELTLWQGLALGAGAGALAVLVGWFLRHPAVGTDGLSYHLPEVVRWVQTGHSGSIFPISPVLPFGNYPLTNEVVLAWGSGMARSFVPVTLWTPAAYLLLLAAAWWGLRELSVPRVTSALAVAALGSSLVVLGQLNGPYTDLPALAWLVTCGALCAGSRRNPALLAVAVLAAGLAVGTKTTTLPLAALCLVIALAAGRRRLRALALPLVLAAVAACAAGGVWYLRNLVTHGSPVWPFATTPWGDPLPPLLERLEHRLIFDPSAAAGRLDAYARVLGGDILLIVGGLAAPLLRRRREVLLAAAATALAFLAWASAPLSGFPPQPFYDSLAAGATRYLMPAFAVGALALALAGAEGGAGGFAARAFLGAAIAANLERTASLGFPFLPSAIVLAAGALVGGAVLAPALVRRAVLRPSPVAAAGAVVIGGALLSAAASGYVERQARISAYTTSGVAWLAARPDFRSGKGAVAMSGRLHGTLAGDRLQHELVPIQSVSGCRGIRARVRGGWVLITKPLSPPAPGFEDVMGRFRRLTKAAEGCLAGFRPAYDDAATRIYASARPFGGSVPLPPKTGIGRRAQARR